ncbi:hypothetical protein [Priestia endophytica]|uniref:hypothetical protein n=1 Tax=Priestia endophytica TaxID=135735 RepID=UPI00115A064F|nr:hypothetical protein [Priestia endophytica]
MLVLSDGNSSEEVCSFYGAPLDEWGPERKNFVYLEQCEQPFSQLKWFRTYDLLILLRFV